MAKGKTVKGTISLTMARQGLLERPVYTLLMTMTFGTVFCACFTAISLTRSGRHELAQSLKRLGRDLIHVHKSPMPQHIFSPDLTLADAALSAEATQGEVSAVRAIQSVATAGDNKMSASLVGTDQTWPRLNRSLYAAGGFFKPGRLDACTLDAWVAQELFGTDQAAGKTLTVNFGQGEKTLTIVGVVKDPMSIRSRLQNLDVLHGSRPLAYRLLEGRNIYVPLETLGSDDKITFCLLKPAEGMDPYEAVKRLRKAFGERGDAMIFWARGVWIDNIFEALHIGYLFSNFIWILFLSLGGAMIMTVSLLAVTDRKLEIGIRRTQGASQWAICSQILLEGSAIALAGALIGGIATPWVGQILSRNLPWRFAIQASSLFYVAGAGILLAAFSFFIPAYRASRFEPVEVLRKR